MLYRVVRTFPEVGRVLRCVTQAGLRNISNLSLLLVVEALVRVIFTCKHGPLMYFGFSRVSQFLYIFYFLINRAFKTKLAGIALVRASTVYLHKARLHFNNT